MVNKIKVDSLLGRIMTKRVILAIIFIIVMCSAIIGGVFAATAFTSVINIARTTDNVDIKGDAVTNWNGKINILVLGKEDQYQNTLLTDTMMLFQIDGATKTIKELSIPRDTRVKYGNSYMKINSVYASKDRELAVMQEVKAITGLPINFYVTIGTSGFVNIINYLGGIDITVPAAMKYSDPAQHLYINIAAGFQHMDGQTAVDYVRFRKGSAGYDGSDTERVARQQGFVQALIKQKLTPANILNAGGIYNEIVKNINTNLTLANVVDLASKVKGMDLSNIQTYTLAGSAQTIGGASYWVLDMNAINKDVLPNFQ